MINYEFVRVLSSVTVLTVTVIVINIIFLKLYKPKIYSFFWLYFLYSLFFYYIKTMLIHPGFLGVMPSRHDLSYYFSNPLFNEKLYEYTSTALSIYSIAYIVLLIGLFIGSKLRITGEYFVHNEDLDENILFALFLIMNWGSFAFRMYYNAGLPSTTSADEIFANYSWYFFEMGSVIIMIYCHYFFMKKNRHIIFHLIIILNYGISSLLLGWKSGIILAIIYYVIVYLIEKRENSIKKIMKMFLILILPLFLIIISFEYITQIRNLITHQDSKIQDISKTIPLSSAQKRQEVIRRILGIEPFTIILYYDNEKLRNKVSFFKNLFQRGTYQPTEYLMYDVLKMERQTSLTQVNSESPTGIGVLFIYGGMTGVLIGFFAIGLFSGFLEVNLKSKIFSRSDRILIYSVSYAFFIPFFWIEGNGVFFMKRYLGSFLFMFFIFKLLTLMKLSGRECKKINLQEDQ